MTGVVIPSPETSNAFSVRSIVAPPPRTVAAKLSDATDASAVEGTETDSSEISTGVVEPLVMTETILLFPTAYTDDSLGRDRESFVDSVYTTNSGIACVEADFSGRIVAELSDEDVGDTTPFSVSIFQSSDVDRITRKFPKTPLEPVSNGASVVRRLSIDERSMSPFPPVQASESVSGFAPEKENFHVLAPRSNST